MKKLLILMLTVFVASICVSLNTNTSVYAENISGTCNDGNHTYEISGEGDERTITISGTGELTYNCEFGNSIGVSGNIRNGIISNNSVKKVVISSGITSIGEQAFSVISDLKSISIPDSVTNIGAGAFWKCASLTSITIPNSVTKIGNTAFCYSGLTGITIPSGVTSIGENAFSNCTNLASVSL